MNGDCKSDWRNCADVAHSCDRISSQCSGAQRSSACWPADSDLALHSEARSEALSDRFHTDRFQMMPDRPLQHCPISDFGSEPEHRTVSNVRSDQRLVRPDHVERHQFKFNSGSSKPVSEPCRSEMGVEPLNSLRLLPTRHKTKNAVLTILENGEVCIEFIKRKCDQERITDVCRISSDGLRVSVYWFTLLHKIY